MDTRLKHAGMTMGRFIEIVRSEIVTSPTAPHNDNPGACAGMTVGMFAKVAESEIATSPAAPHNDNPGGVRGNDNGDVR